MKDEELETETKRRGTSALTRLLCCRWYLLGQPWCHSDQAGMTILAGDPDPHIGTFVADAEVMMDLVEGENWDKQRARGIAQHIVDLHNSNLE